MPGSPAHLVSRFFDSLTARPLDSAERVTVETWLDDPDLARLFFEQGSADQRHGYQAGLYVVGERGDPETVTTALLHDVGKRHARLGILGRSLASILILVHGPLTERMRAYRDHGRIGAGELGALQAPSLAIDFALHHHGARPPTIAGDTWDLLLASDRPQRRRPAHRGR